MSEIKPSDVARRGLVVGDGVSPSGVLAICTIVQLLREKGDYWESSFSLDEHRLLTKQHPRTALKKSDMMWQQCELFVSQELLRHVRIPVDLEEIPLGITYEPTESFHNWCLCYIGQEDLEESSQISCREEIPKFRAKTLKVERGLLS